MTSSITAIEKLNVSNYDTWKILMKSALIFHGLWKFVEFEKPDQKPVDWCVEKEQKALAFIILCVEKELLIHVKNAKSAHEAWKMLDRIFNGTTPSRKVSLYKKLIKLKCDDYNNITEHLTEFMSILDQLSSLGLNFDEEIKAIILLSSLPTSFDNFIIAIETRDELPTMEILKNKIIEEFNRQSQNDNNRSSEAVLQIKVKGNNTRKTKSGPKQLICYFCKRSGHFCRNCPEKQKLESKSSSAMSAALADAKDDNVWVLDSGASHHLVNNINFMQKMIKINDDVRLADNSVIKAKGRGTAKVKFRGHEIDLLDAVYVPDLKNNFISISSAINNGCNVKFGRNGALICKNGKTIVSAKCRNGLYSVNCDNSKVTGYRKMVIDRSNSVLEVRTSICGPINIDSCVETNKNDGIVKNENLN